MNRGRTPPAEVASLLLRARKARLCVRRTRRRPDVALTLAVALALVTAVLAPGCAREVTYGPAGEPAGSRQPSWLRFTVETDPAHASDAAAYAAFFAVLGVRANVQVLPREEVVSRALAGQSDASLLGWSGFSRHPLGMAGAKLSSEGAENFSGYANPEVDLLLAGLLSRPQVADQQECARACQEFLYEEAPWVFGVEEPLSDASVATLVGWLPGPAGAVSLQDATLTTGQARAVVGLGLAERPKLDPLRPIGPQAGILFRCLFDSLAAVGQDGSLQPELAASWEWSTNGRELAVRLRDGVVFHNGDPLSASDVVFTYERVLAGRLPRGLVKGVAVAGAGNGAAAGAAAGAQTGGEGGPRTRSGGTVVFTFSAPFPSFLELFGLQPIVPAKYYETVGPEGFAAAPVGAGPFRFDPARNTRQLVLYRWDRYYGGSPALPPAGRASLAEVAFAFVPDPARRVAMLRSGQIVLAPALPLEVAGPLAAEAGLTVAREPGTSAVFLELNNRRPPFDDARVRLALNYAVDGPALVAASGNGCVRLPTAFFPDGYGFSADAGGFSQSLEEAKRLLREAGYLVSEP